MGFAPALRLLRAAGAASLAMTLGCAGAGHYSAYRKAHPEWNAKTPSLGADLEATVAGLYAPPKGQYQVLVTKLEVFRTDADPWLPVAVERIGGSAREDYVVIANLTCVSVVELETYTDDKVVWYYLPENYLVAYDHHRFGEQCVFWNEFAPAELRHAEIEARILERVQSRYHRTISTRFLYLRGLSYLEVGRLDAAERLLADGEAQFDPSNQQSETWRSTTGERYRVAGADEREVVHNALRRALAEGRAAIDGSPAPEAVSIEEGSERQLVTEALGNLAGHFAGQRNFEVAVRLRRRVVEIQEVSSGSTSEETAAALSHLGWVLMLATRHEESEEVLRRALSIRESLAGVESLPVANTSNDLGIVVREGGDLEEARRAHERALDISRKAQAKSDSDVALAQHVNAVAYLSLGILDTREGQFGSAKGNLERALAMQEARIGPKHPELTVYLEWLGRLHQAIGDADGATPFFERLVEIQKRSKGPAHPDTAEALALATTPFNPGVRVAQLDRALEIYEEAVGADDVRLLALLLERADALDAHPDQAGPLIERALGIAKKHSGEASTDVAWCLHRRGDWAFREGDLDRARRDWLRSLEIYRAHSRPDSQVLGSLQLALAAADALAGDFEGAWRNLGASFTITRSNLPRFLVASSEGATIGLQDELAQVKSLALTLIFQRASDSQSHQRLAAEAAMLLKGRGMAIARKQRERIAESAEPAALGRLASLDSEIAQLSLADAEESNEQALRERLTGLAQDRARLSAELPAFEAGGTSASTLDHVLRSIPSGALVIDYEVFTPFLLETSRPVRLRSRWGEARYAALALRPDGILRWLDLGPVAAADAEIDELIDSVARITGNPQDPASALYERLLGSLDDEISASELLLISPDEALSTIPFEVLLDPASRYLIERLPVAYLSSLEEVAAPRAAKPHGPPLVLGSPNFDGSPAQPKGGALLASVRSALPGETAFPPLPGTASEARALASLWSDAIVLTGDDASEARLRHVRGPRILHLATHGYFLPRFSAMGEATWSERTRVMTTLGTEIPFFDTAMLSSGLAFAGANTGGASGHDGVLTAFEAMGLDLRGTQLVTLSACETGLGEVTVYEGVTGLRRALSIAGAETVVMSLWRVPDAITVDLMKSFYQGLARGESRALALQNAKLRLLNQGHHPYEWAAFISSGDWRPLR